MQKDEAATRLVLSQSIGFLTLMFLSWADEVIGLRTLVLGDHPYISDFREATLEILVVLVVWLLVYRSSQRVLKQVQHLESFVRVCAWCRRVHFRGQWIRLEEFLHRNYDAPTSHGICEVCFQQERSAAKDLQLKLGLEVKSQPGQGE
jgi:hypothetical protein